MPPTAPPLRAEPARQVIEVTPSAAGHPRHINDHCFTRGPDGLWHLFGIVWTNPGLPAPDVNGLGHFSAPSLLGPWTELAPALILDAAAGETILWAPHVVRHDGLYYMVYASGGPDERAWGVSLAVSRDLRAWERRPGPLFRDGYQARDPMLHYAASERLWVLYYCATETPGGGRHAVAYRTSQDLKTWSPREIAYLDPHTGTDYGPTESPFVVERFGTWYLFIGPRPYDPPTEQLPNWRHPGYDGADVFASRDWRRWDDPPCAHLPLHAVEVVQDDDAWYASHAGIERGGLWLARLHWS